MMSTKLLNFVKPAIKRSVIPGRCTNIHVVSHHVYGPAYKQQESVPKVGGTPFAYKPSGLSYAFQSQRYLSTSSSFKIRFKNLKEKKNEKKESEKKIQAEFQRKLIKFGIIGEAVRMIFWSFYRRPINENTQVHLKYFEMFRFCTWYPKNLLFITFWWLPLCFSPLL